ncbi:MAG: hypothetical protein ACRDNP_14645 [Gaiellaceae bacterium]
MPESGLPIRVYKEHDMWHVDYGEGEMEDYARLEEAETAADAVAQAEERTVVVEESRPRAASQNAGKATTPGRRSRKEPLHPLLIASRAHV